MTDEVLTKILTMKILSKTTSCLALLVLIAGSLYSQGTDSNTSLAYRLENPMSVQYLKKNLRRSQPRLVLNAAIEKNLKRKLDTDPLIQNIYASIKYNTEMVLDKDLITVDIPDNPNSQRNQLGISRDFLWLLNNPVPIFSFSRD